jgi:hypothetical protein
MALTLDQISQFVCGKVGQTDAASLALFNVLPRQPFKYLCNSASRDAVFPSKRSRVKNLAIRQKVAKFTDGIIRQLRAAMLLAMNPSLSMGDGTVSAFCRTIPHIVRVRSWEKMLGIDAARVIAVVTDTKPLADRAVFYHPRKAMGVMLLPIQSDHAVAISGSRCLPRPTLINSAYCDLVPKARMKRLCQELFDIYNHALSSMSGALLATTIWL